MGFGARFVVTLVMLAMVIGGVLLVLRIVGKQHVAEAVAQTDELMVDVGGGTDQVADASGLPENHILYNGEEYALNEDIVTFLIMGIDKETVTEIGGQSWEASSEFFQGGQADALFLVLIDPHKEAIEIITINRNSMADVDVWDEDGRYKGVYNLQIALQHGYGDGGAESCERQVLCVSRFMHGITINGYAAISMDAIPELNDAVGGITVEVLDDIVYPEYDMDLHKGDTVTLYGDKAYWYVRLRDENAFESNSLRQRRQQQYLTTFAATAKSQAVSDVRVAANLYQTLQKYMVTDIDLSSFTYLVTEYAGYDFDINNMYSVQGETVIGNKGFEEYNVDEDALERLIVDLYFEKVGEAPMSARAAEGEALLN